MLISARRVVLIEEDALQRDEHLFARRIWLYSLEFVAIPSRKLQTRRPPPTHCSSPTHDPSKVIAICIVKRVERPSRSLTALRFNLDYASPDVLSRIQPLYLGFPSSQAKDESVNSPKTLFLFSPFPPCEPIFLQAFSLVNLPSIRVQMCRP